MAEGAPPPEGLTSVHASRVCLAVCLSAWGWHASKQVLFTTHFLAAKIFVYSLPISTAARVFFLLCQLLSSFPVNAVGPEGAKAMAETRATLLRGGAQCLGVRG